MKQSMQGTAAATDQSNVVKDAGAKQERHHKLFRKLEHSGKSLGESVFSFSRRLGVSVCMFNTHKSLFHVVLALTAPNYSKRAPNSLPWNVGRIKMSYRQFSWSQVLKGESHIITSHASVP